MKKTLACFIMLCLIAVHTTAQSLQLRHLRCEDRQQPSAVQTVQPRLSWQLYSDRQNVTQTAYRILVADDSLLLKKNTGNIWDSRKVQSAASVQVVYRGKPLQAAKKYYWKLMIWDNQGKSSDWSPVASWQMGLLSKADWGAAQWIGYDELPDSLVITPHVHLNGKKAWGPRPVVLPYLRKQVAIKKAIRSAIIFISGLGHAELSVNGSNVGDQFLAPGWTNYSKQALYVAHDITSFLKQGENVLGVLLGNGFYYIPSQRYRKMTGGWGYPKLKAKTVIEYTDGSLEVIITDESWKTSPSPVIFSSLYGGEDYDATKEQPGWNSPGFNDQNWKQAIRVQGPDVLIAEMQEPVKIMQQFNAVNTITLREGITVSDFGQNFSGIPAITVSGKKGDTVRLYAAELLNADNTANQKATGSPSYFTYILKGNGTETWHPLFSYTGMRYAEVHCIPRDSGGARPVVTAIEGLHIRNAAAEQGSFSCSNALFNRIHTLIDWAIKSNMVSVFTDCPHREKLGWLEQTHLMGASVQYRYDVASLNRKVMNDLQLSQYPDGRIPEIAPEMVKFTPPFDESPEWGSASVILPWYNYRWYGDRQALQSSYPMMKEYLRFLKDTAKNNILSHGLGDWFDIGPKKSGFAQMTKMGVTATATYYYDLTIMMKVAALLNKPADLAYYTALAKKVKTAFNNTFFDPVKLQYDSASQTANAMALYMGLVEDRYKQAVVNALVKDIQSRNNALTAGDIGFRYVLKALEQAGRNDIIYDMNSREDVPGYGYQLKHGATALTESWQAYESVSNNHFMLGHLMEWFYSGLAGIRQTSSSVAFHELEIRPEPVGDITAVNTAFETPYGRVTNNWEKSDSLYTQLLVVPANSRAVVYLPVPAGKTIYMNGVKVKAMYSNGKAVIKTGSGTYRFSVALK